jgi:hypothetical protein
LKYSFNKVEFRNLKGKIAEGLVNCYIEENVIPLLQKSWDKVIFTPQAWFGDEVEENKHRPDYMKIFWRHEEKFFIKNKLFPTQSLMVKFKKLTKTLQNVPDGFLFKLKFTGEHKRLNEALKQLQVLSSWEEGDHAFNYHEQNGDELLPTVDGDIEVIEIKADKSNVPSHQQQSYKNIVKEGYTIRFFHVDESLFNNNEFEIEEKLITEPNQIVTFPIKPK